MCTLKDKRSHTCSAAVHHTVIQLSDLSDPYPTPFFFHIRISGFLKAEVSPLPDPTSRFISRPLKVNNSPVCLDLYFQHSKHFSLFNWMSFVSWITSGCIYWRRMCRRQHNRQNKCWRCSFDALKLHVLTFLPKNLVLLPVTRLFKNTCFSAAKCPSLSKIISFRCH